MEDFSKSPNVNKQEAGALTNVGWNVDGVTGASLPVATLNDKKVEVSGKLSFYFAIDRGALGSGFDKHYEHELTHAYIAKAMWNANASLVDAWEGEYSSVRCAMLAAEIANLISSENQASERISTYAFDIQEYGSTTGAGGDVRNSNKARYDYWVTRESTLKEEIAEKKTWFQESGCSKCKQK